MKTKMIFGTLAAAVMIAGNAFAYVTKADIAADCKNNYSEADQRNPNSAVNRGYKSTYGYNCIDALPKTQTAAEKFQLLLFEKQSACNKELKVQSCSQMDPLSDSNCDIGTQELPYKSAYGSTQTNYVAFYNKRLKVITVKTTPDCKEHQYKVEGEFTKSANFDGKLFLLINSKPYFIDNSGSFSELVSYAGNSYTNTSTSIVGMKVNTVKNTLDIEYKQGPAVDAKVKKISINKDQIADKNRSNKVELGSKVWIQEVGDNGYLLK